MLNPFILFYLNLASPSQDDSFRDWLWSFLKPPFYFVSTLAPLPRTIRNPSLGGNSWTLLGRSGCYCLLQHRDHLGTTPLPNRADPWFVQTALGDLKIKHKPTKNPTAIIYFILCVIITSLPVLNRRACSNYGGLSLLSHELNLN